VKKDVEASILKLIAEQFGLASVHPKDRLIEDLKGDALDAIELVMSLEEKFNVQIPDEKVDTIITVQDAITCVETKILVNE
jgi:acyl carrier protein